MTNIKIHWTVFYATIYLLNLKNIYYEAVRFSRADERNRLLFAYNCNEVIGL